jgi:hypothetical protein
LCVLVCAFVCPNLHLLVNLPLQRTLKVVIFETCTYFCNIHLSS